MTIIILKSYKFKIIFLLSTKLTFYEFYELVYCTSSVLK